MWTRVQRAAVSTLSLSPCISPDSALALLLCAGPSGRERASRAIRSVYCMCVCVLRCGVPTSLGGGGGPRGCPCGGEMGSPSPPQSPIFF